MERQIPKAGDCIYWVFTTKNDYSEESYGIECEIVKTAIASYPPYVITEEDNYVHDWFFTLEDAKIEAKRCIQRERDRLDREEKRINSL